ncbi:GLT8D1, partial [Symbiodinium necroappetens]
RSAPQHPYDAQDKLNLPEDLGVALQLEREGAEETRQCLCLHVALAFEPDLLSAWEKARDLRRELWEDSSAAFQHLGDASPYISTAEAFVRHNAHDCIYPDHEKDFRVLQLFARRFMQGRVLVVLRLSHHGVVEVDTVKSAGALESYGVVVIHRGHMRTARCPPAQIEQLLEIATQGERVIRELEVEGWGGFLETQAGVEEDDAGDPARPPAELGDSGLPEAEPSPQPAAPHPPSLGVGGSMPKLAEAEEERVGGTVEGAVQVLNAARVKKLGDHLEGAKQNEAKNHGSVYGYEEELLQKVSHLLDRAGVAESPLGLVRKQNPDRTISAEGLIILSLAMPFGWVVVVEPMAGNREFDSLAVLDETMQLVWGPEEVNVEKMAEALPPALESRGGDATLERIGAVDWKAKVFHAERVEQYREGLRRLAKEGDETDIISVMELLAFVVLACHRRDEWAGELVLYVTDNMNVRTWLRKRRPRNRTASLLVRLIQRLESENSFTVHPIYIRTYRNQLTHWLSREDLPLVREQLVAEGWTEVETRIHWEDFLRDAKRSALVYPAGEDP